jgi:hypothetical protein
MAACSSQLNTLEVSDKLWGKPNGVSGWNPRRTQLLYRSLAAAAHASSCRLCLLMMLPKLLPLGRTQKWGHLMSTSACRLFALVSFLPLSHFSWGSCVCKLMLSVLDFPGFRRARIKPGRRQRLGWGDNLGGYRRDKNGPSYQVPVIISHLSL